MDFLRIFRFNPINFWIFEFKSNYMKNYNDTICALSTANGIGAIAVIRVSGEQALEIVSSIFSKDLNLMNFSEGILLSKNIFLFKIY